MSDEIDALSDRVNTDKNVDGLRIDIANLMARLLEGKRETLTYWDKSCFAYALSALHWNIDSGLISYTAWLELSLTALRNLLVPEDKRSDRVVVKPISTATGLTRLRM
ncbi:MAG: hypothetical protein JWQ50_3836 [Caballeronia mineralivorans]|jgi:hypothetical protein|nr:hypothetical protein [Caballeronia mineralivorans]MEA3098975.1 hypothetical protein [Caballeronia mineralivorans]